MLEGMPVKIINPRSGWKGSCSKIISPTFEIMDNTAVWVMIYCGLNTYLPQMFCTDELEVVEQEQRS